MIPINLVNSLHARLRPLVSLQDSYDLIVDDLLHPFDLLGALFLHLNVQGRSCGSTSITCKSHDFSLKYLTCFVTLVMEQRNVRNSHLRPSYSRKPNIARLEFGVALAGLRVWGLRWPYPKKCVIIKE
ncbi:hypothetical protein VNO77_34334 [Canavalia gladiata]|uniref:Uncharacterized protein n=1 Tax=Canavalia gladiata TaxID=3824 RepID=A0AAN9KG00_CANGL